MYLVMIGVINSIAISLPVLLGLLGQANDVRELPAPTGRFQIGRVTVHLTDTSRTEPVAAGGGPRELRVDIWYPADAGASAAPASASARYIDPAAFDRPESAKRLQGLLRGAYDAVREGRVRTHASENVPFARAVRQAPVLIFSHGGGEARETYSAQLEDLASHGYVVAAISHTYESVLTMFPDGRHAVLLSGRWPRPTTSAIEGLPPSEEANPDRLRWWANDIRFVLGELTVANRINAQAPRPAFSGLPFSGRLDLQRVGAFGHSAGGQAAATACQIEPRLRACLNQDGLSAMAPYYPDASGWGMDQAFMLMVRNPPREDMKDEELAAMKMTRAQVQAIMARLDARQDAALRNTGGGAWRVLIEASPNTTTHADFTDLQFLQSATAAETDMRARMLGTVRVVTRAFFDKTLNGSNAPLAALVDGRDRPPFVERVQQFEPARRSKQRR
jgi:predicted dienelactone hydrolase